MKTDSFLIPQPGAVGHGAAMTAIRLAMAAIGTKGRR